MRHHATVRRKEERHRSTIASFLIVGAVITVAIFGLLAKRQSEIASETVSLDNADYYPAYLPYQAKDVRELPFDVPNGTIDPTHPVVLHASGFHNEYLPLQDRLYLVQYKDELPTEAYMDLRPIRTFQNHTYVLHVMPDELKRFIADPRVNYLDHYHPHYKLTPDVVEAYYNQRISPKTKLRLIFSPNTLIDEREGLVKGAGASIFSSEGSTAVVAGLDDRQRLFVLALSPIVSEIRLEH